MRVRKAWRLPFSVGTLIIKKCKVHALYAPNERYAPNIVMYTIEEFHVKLTRLGNIVCSQCGNHMMHITISSFGINSTFDCTIVVIPDYYFL